MRSCLIGMRLADELGLGAGARSDLFYALLLKDAGCSANSARMAALFAADDHEAKRTSKRVDWARPFPAFVWSLRTVAPGGSLRARAERLRAIRDEGEVTMVSDQRLQPTFTADLAEAVIATVDRNGTGVVHLTASGECYACPCGRTVCGKPAPDDAALQGR